MKSYQYIARDPIGGRKEGLTEASASNDVLNWLRGQGYTPISVNEVSLTKRKRRSKKRKRIKSADLAALCWQLTTMLEGGISVVTALETISSDIDNTQLQQVLEHVSEQVNKGQPFSECIREFPKIFNNLACAMILAGETSGDLAEAMHKLAEYYDDRDKLAKKVKGAIAYPVFVFSFITLIVIFIMAFIVPRFKTIFGQMGSKLPALTEGFLNSYDILKHNLPYIIGTLVVLVVSVIFLSKTPKGHLLISRILLRLPLFGKVLSQAFLVTFCRTMATLLASGVSVLDAFDILSTMSQNDVIKNAILQTREHVVGGSNLSMSMTTAGFFPNMIIKMMQVGEQSGSLSTVLERTSDYYERKVDSTITTLTGMLEPIMIVTVGAIVSVVVVALYLPIFTMSDVAK